MGNISNILVRMRELAVQAANGTLGDDDRAAIQTEVTALVEQIDDIAERTTFNGTDLLTGDATTPTDPVTISIQTGVNDGETVDISIKALTAEALGVHDGTDTIDLSSAAGASASLTTLDPAPPTVATGRANLGAQPHRLAAPVQSAPR